MKIPALLAVSLLASTAALADTHDPIPGKLDSRIRTFPYDPANTLRLSTPGLTPVRVIFAPGETPVTFAGTGIMKDQAKATDWFVTDVGNALLVQPLRADLAPTVMFVATRKDGEQNNYVIELHVGKADVIKPDPDAYIQVSYTYPQIAAAAAAEARAKALRVQTESKVRTSLTQARFSAPRQWRYSKMGADCATMTPSGWNWISDDGHQTALLFPPHMAGASIFSRENDDDKNESLITPIPTTTAVGTLEVLPDVYKQIVLRRGDKVCAIRSDRYDPIGTQPGGGSGTISADVIRIRARQTR